MALRFICACGNAFEIPDSPPLRAYACRKCGASVAVEEAPAPVEAAAGNRTCEQCGKETPARATTCWTCGWDRAALQRRCVRCQGAVDLEDRTGFTLNEAAVIAAVGVIADFALGGVGAAAVAVGGGAVVRMVGAASAAWRCRACGHYTPPDLLSPGEQAAARSRRKTLLCQALWMGLGSGALWVAFAWKLAHPIPPFLEWF